MTYRNLQKRAMSRDSFLSPVRLPVSPPGDVAQRGFMVKSKAWDGETIQKLNPKLAGRA